MKKVLNDLYDYNNRMIYQDLDSFKFSLDSILLAEYVNLNSKKTKILDLCTGNAAIPLIISTKTDAFIDAFEIQKEIFELGKESIIYNGLSSQISIYNDNVKNIDKYIKNKKYDIITANPPYFKVLENSHINNTNTLAIARHEIEINLEEIFNIASSHLNDKGEFYLVHRATRIDEIIIYANKNNLNVKKITFVKTKLNSKPYIVLVKCVKNSKLGVKINNEVCIENLKTYQGLFKE